MKRNSSSGTNADKAAKQQRVEDSPMIIGSPTLSQVEEWANFQEPNLEPTETGDIFNDSFENDGVQPRNDQQAVNLEVANERYSDVDSDDSFENDGVQAWVYRENLDDSFENDGANMRVETDNLDDSFEADGRILSELNRIPAVNLDDSFELFGLNFRNEITDETNLYEVQFDDSVYRVDLQQNDRGIFEYPDTEEYESSRGVLNVTPCDFVYLDQDGGAPIREIDQVAHVECTQRSVKRRGNFINVTVRNLTFPNLENMTDPIHITLPRVLDQFMDDCLEASNVSNPRRALFCMTMKHPSFDKGSLFSPFRHRDLYDGMAMLNQLKKIQQSNRNMILNDQLTIEMEIYDEVNHPVVELNGQRNVRHYFDKQLGIAGVIKNTDRYCLARAFAVGKMKSDIEECPEGSEEQKRLRRKCSNYIQRGTPDLHVQILQRARVSLDKASYNVRDLARIALVYPDYKIILYTRPPGQKMYTIHSMFNKNASSVIYIGHNDNHYDWIHVSTERKLFASICCRHCKSTYSCHTRNHKCRAKCTKCHSVGCVGLADDPNYSIKCSGCNVIFMKQSCFINHKGSVCRKFKVCTKCDTYHERIFSRPHQCGHAFCRKCCKLQPKVHQCCWAVPSDEKKKEAQEKQQKYKIVFFDFETVVLADGVDVKNYAPEQWPNLVVYNRICHTCLASDSCESCGPKEDYIRYESGDHEWSVTDRFLDWILTNPANNKSTFVSHNGSRFDNHFVLSRLIARGIYPKLVMNGSQIIIMTIEPLPNETFNTVTFKDSYLLVPLPLAALPSAFGITSLAKGEFPYLYNHPVNYHTVIPTLPERQFFCTDRKKSKDLAEFNTWYAERSQEPFDFDKELLDYCRMDVRILRECITKYMLLATELTGWNPIIHCSTFASFSLYQLKMNHMKPDQIGVLPEGGYMGNQTQSKIALKYIKWLEHTLGRSLKYKLNGGEHMVMVQGKKYLLDAYDSSTNTAYEINGCYYHGCPKCTNPESRAPGGDDTTMAQVYARTQARLLELESTNLTVITIWEHEITNELRTNNDMKKFFDDCNVITRLIPRDAFLGGRTQTYKLLAEAHGSKELMYDDFVSLYPYVTAFVADYPVGAPTVITSNFKSFESSCPYKGLVKCDVLPPQGLRFPVIGARIGQKLIFTNCRKCAERAKNVECTHTDPVDRIIHTTVTHVELQCAIERGYIVTKVYEVWSWDQWEKGGLFKDFVRKYIKIKQEASGWPKPNMTTAEQDIYLQANQEHVGVELDRDRIEKNPAMRSIAKLQLNSVWGKMGQRSDKTQTSILSNTDPRIGVMLNDPTSEITGFKVFDDLVYITWQPASEYLEPANYTNVAIAAYTTAHARLLLYSAMEKVGDDLVYTDTDSLIYLWDKTKPNPLAEMRGEWLGKLTSEIPSGWRMTKFVSPAAKVYSYILENDSGETKIVTKAKGVTLDNCASSIINYEGLVSIVKGFVECEREDVLNVNTTLIKRDLGHIKTVDALKRTRVVMDKLRFLPNYDTLPYGYNV